MGYFIFNGVDSRDFKGLVVNKLPDIIKPSEKVEKYDLPSRHGNMVIPTGFFEQVSKKIECTLKDPRDIDKIIRLLNGSGEFIFSNQPDRFYKATIVNAIPFERIIRQARRFIIELECEPFGYLIGGKELITITEPTQIGNKGNYESEPIITISGRGNVGIVIGQQNFTLENIVDNITVDTPLLEVYQGVNVLNKKFRGEFPIIPLDDSLISWTGDVSKIEIITNWRCL
ncbi:phage tail domain-containing protein [uncultured Clostridium sp.]|uniref:phage tail domain-containing protein n=1 Tax=uncultured Clostridium sp. TaxID=59620 RepID=UPI00262A6B89|nr:phage tail domain-containing protein [uncultured Clostridium sp.]